MSLAEPVDDLISLRTILRTVQRRHLVSLLNHPLRDVVCLLPVLHDSKLASPSPLLPNDPTHLTENDTLPNRQDIIQHDQLVVFVLLARAVEEELFDRSHVHLLLLELDLVRVRREPVRELAHVVVEGRGEEDGLVAEVAGRARGTEEAIGR